MSTPEAILKAAAGSFLERLLEQDAIELTAGWRVDQAAEALIRSLDRLDPRRPSYGASIAEVLMLSRAVEDLFADDDVLEAVARREWISGQQQADALERLLETGGLRNPELECAIEADADDETLLQAYGDWLSERGDPQGTLINLQSAAAAPGLADDARQRLEHEAERYLEQFRGYFMQRLAGWEEALSLTWRGGFIHSATLRSDDLVASGDPPTLLDLLLALPAARFLRRLELGPLRRGGWDDVLAKLAKRRLPALRSLRLVGAQTRAASPLDLASFPGLTELDLGLGPVAPIALESETLRRVELDLQATEARWLVALADAKLPNLESLAVRIRAGIRRGTSIDADARAVTAVRFPCLRALSVRVPEEARAFAAAALGGELAARLVELDLSECHLRDADIGEALARPDRLTDLTRLDLRRNQLSSAMASRLAEALPCADVSEQVPEGHVERPIPPELAHAPVEDAAPDPQPNGRCDACLRPGHLLGADAWPEWEDGMLIQCERCQSFICSACADPTNDDDNPSWTCRECGHEEIL